MSRPTTLSVAEALEVVRAKSARWASTFDPTDGTVLCRRREYARRADGRRLAALEDALPPATPRR